MGFNTHLWGFQEDRSENMHFKSKPSHVTPQINHLRKLSHVLRISTHIYGVSKEIDGKTVHFESKPTPCDPSNQLSQKIEPCSEDFNTHLWGFQGDRWENVHFKSKPRHVTPQIDCLGKLSLVLRVSTHIYGVSKEIDGKMFIFRVNLGMWPLKSIISEKKALFWGFQHTFMEVLRR